MRDQQFLDGLTEQPIGRAVQVGTFKCNPFIDWFLTDVACDYQEKRISAVTCWMDGADLAGYVTASMDVVEIAESAQREELHLTGVTRKQGGTHIKRFPTLLIGMLGVCDRYRRRGLASHMIKVTIGRARVLSKDVGCRFVTVDSDPTREALAFYDSVGFKQVAGQKKRDTVWMYFDLGPIESR